MKNKLFKVSILGVALVLLGGAVINSGEPLPIGSVAIEQITPNAGEPLPIGMVALDQVTPNSGEPLPIGAA